MSFLYPKFLWALLLLVVPLIIHLFNFRPYRTVYFSNVAFLQQLKVDTKSRSKIRQLLLLISRMLGIAFLVLYFAGPYKNKATKQALTTNDLVCLYVDNSFSMEGVNERGMLLDQAKLQILDMLEVLPPSTKYLLTTNNFSQAHGKLMDREQLLESLSKVEAGGVPRKLSEVIRHQQYVLNREPRDLNVNVFLISDFQQNTANFNELVLDSLHQYYLVPLKNSSQQNLLIDSVKFKTPGHYLGKREIIQVRLKNYATENFKDMPLQFFVNDTLRFQQNFSILSKETKWVEFPYFIKQAGLMSCKVAIRDYPISFDNTLYFNFHPGQKIRVLSIYEQNDYFKPLFYKDSNVVFSSMLSTQINYGDLLTYDVIYLNDLNDLSNGFIEKLKQYVLQGGHLVFVPGMQANLTQYNFLMSELALPNFRAWMEQEGSMQTIDYKNSLFDGVFETQVNQSALVNFNGRYAFNNRQGSGIGVIASAASGHPLLIEKEVAKGKVFVSYLPLHSSVGNFRYQGIFVPLFYNMALHSKHLKSLYHAINPGMLASFYMQESNGVFTLQKEQLELYPKTYFTNGVLKVSPPLEELKAGTYKLNLDDVGLAEVSFNYNRLESLLSYYTEDALSKLSIYKTGKVKIFNPDRRSLSTYLIKEQQDSDLGKWFLLAVLAMLLAEALIVRFLP